MTNLTLATDLFGVSLDDICEANDIEYLGLFGSYARGDFRPDSDVDLLVRFTKPIGLFALVHAEIELSERLGKKVDLVIDGSLSPYIKDRVMAQVRTLYDRA